MLRRSQKPVVLVVNKVDSVQKYMMDVYEFYNLGIGEPGSNFCGQPYRYRRYAGCRSLREFPENLDAEEDDDIPKVAVVGKPNVGKSSLINKLLAKTE